MQAKMAEERQKEIEDMANQPFARMADDPALEHMRKDTLRDGDPMAEYFRSKREQEEEERRSKEALLVDTPLVPKKPVYKGPAPPSNRFNIMPGYRWDAIDRSNGFEVMLLKTMNTKASLKEDAYRWSVSDM